MVEPTVLPVPTPTLYLVHIHHNANGRLHAQGAFLSLVRLFHAGGLGRALFVRVVVTAQVVVRLRDTLVFRETVDDHGAFHHASLDVADSAPGSYPLLQWWRC